MVQDKKVMIRNQKYYKNPILLWQQELNLFTEDNIVRIPDFTEVDLEMVQLLVTNNGADMNKAMRKLIFIASVRGHLEILKCVIQNGADLNQQNNNCATPLYIASRNGHLEIVKLLTISGADVNCPNNNGATPLYVASRNGHFEIVQFLIKNGADVNPSNNNGGTPLYIATYYGYFDIVKILVDYNAHVNMTLLAISLGRRHLEISKFLIKNGADVTKTKLYLQEINYVAELGLLETIEKENLNLLVKTTLNPYTTIKF
jgi:serine/threonine-protein phosphatase 6 regulatory ankyrin repeat subunit B